MSNSPPAPAPKLALIALLAAAGLSSGAGDVAAQSTRPSVMILAPVPEAAEADSAYVQQLAREIRDRLIRKKWRRFRTLRVCNVSDACERLVEGENVRTYARLALADYFVSGRYSRTGQERLFQFDIGETNLSGGFAHHTASMDAVLDATMDLEEQVERLADVIYESLRSVSRAGVEARKCWADLLDRKYGDARRHAARAMEDFPEHPYAGTCASLVFSESGAASDSIVWALERVTRGDSTIHQAWADLAHAYLSSGDTARAVGAMAREVRADREDRKRLARVARDMNEYGFPDSATTVLDEFLTLHPLDEEMGEVRIRLCAHVTNYRCALRTMSQRYQADTALIGDTTFYFRAIAMARAAQSSTLEWTTEALAKMTDARDSAWARVARATMAARRMDDASQEMLIAHAGALASAGMNDSAIAVYESVLAADSTAPRAALGLARILITPGRLVIDSAAGLDTTALEHVRTIIEAAVASTDDTLYQHTAGTLYLDVAGRMLQARSDPLVAMAWADRAGELAGEDQALLKRGRALRGVAAFYRMVEIDGTLRADPTCDLLDEENRLIAEGQTDLSFGASEFPEAADRLLSAFAAYQQLVPAHHEALQCEWILADVEMMEPVETGDAVEPVETVVGDSGR